MVGTAVPTFRARFFAHDARAFSRRRNQNMPKTEVTISAKLLQKPVIVGRGTSTPYHREISVMNKRLYRIHQRYTELCVSVWLVHLLLAPGCQ